MYKFFFVIPVNFEEIAKIELIEKVELFFKIKEIEDIKLLKGGIEAILPLETGLLLNQILKIPSKILLRIDEFKCRDAPKLFKKIQKINWAQFLVNEDVLVKTSAKNSRLFDSRKVEKAVQDGLKKYFIANTPSQKNLKKFEEVEFKPEVLINLKDEICTVSINTSGELLYKRGYKQEVVRAPIRENLSSALIYEIIQLINPQNKYIFIDPMCGSGTNVFEAFNLLNPILNRSFMFEIFPISDKLVKLEMIKQNSLFLKLLGSDISKEAIEKADKNSLFFKDDNILFKVDDLFSDEVCSDDCHRVVLVNPPYNRRLKIEEDADIYYRKILESISSRYKPELMGIIVSGFLNLNISGYKLLTQKKFLNGGLEVCFLIFKADTI